MTRWNRNLESRRKYLPNDYRSDCIQTDRLLFPRRNAIVEVGNKIRWAVYKVSVIDGYQPLTWHQCFLLFIATTKHRITVN